MKITNRQENSFNGEYIGYHDEISFKSTPLYFKFLFFLTILVVPAGVLIGIYGAEHGYIELFCYAVLGTIIIEFPMIHLLLVLFDKIKYGEIRKELKIIGPILSGVSILLLIGIILSRFLHFAIICSTGIILIFYGIGIGLMKAGSNIVKQQKKNCTMPVLAVCSGYETLAPHLNILDESDATHAQNEIIATAEVRRPIWEFNLNGITIHAVPEHYEGNLKIVQNKQYKIFVNPQNPQEIYCNDNDNARFLLGMGKFWLIFTTAMVVLMGVGAFLIIHFAL